MARKSKFFRDAHGIQFTDCPVCDGAGELIVNETNPHGYGPDPQCDEPETCFECLGTGTLRVTPVDVLENLRWARQKSRGRGLVYEDTRYKAMRPSFGIRHAEFMANVSRTIECVRELRQQVAA